MFGTCIVSCCYSEGRPDYYAKYADRLEASLERFHPGTERKIWRDGWPPGSPSHSKLHYGFKFYALLWAIEQGYRRVIWLDAGTELLAPMDPVEDKLKRDGYALLTGPDVLGEWISDGALADLKSSRERAMELKLAGGCLIGLDVSSTIAMIFFAKYRWLAQKTRHFMCYHTEQSIKDGVMRSVLVTDGDNIPLSDDPRVKGHRSDEACFSILMDQLGMTPMTITEWQTFARTY
jgi:hypothetical protein